MSDENIRTLEHAGDIAAELAAKQRAGLEGGRLYLTGHVSFETAHIAAGYPYGRRGKCLRATWIEFKPKFGFRVVHRTTAPYYPEDGQEAPDPKSARWNKPHPGQYCEVAVLYLDHVGHIQRDSLGAWNPDSYTAKTDAEKAAAVESDIERFKARAKAAITPEVEKAIKFLTIQRRALSRIKYEVKAATSEPIDIFGDPLAQEKLAALAKDEDERKKKERRLVGALLANEAAAADGRPLPVPSLGTAENPPPSASP